MTKYQLDGEWPNDGTEYPPDTFFVNPHDGDNKKDGTSLAEAWKSPQHATEWIYENVSCNLRQPRIQFTPCVCNQNIQLCGQLQGVQVIGGGPLIYRGIPEYKFVNGTWVPYPGIANFPLNQEYYLISTPNSCCFSLDLYAAAVIFGLALDAPGGACVYATTNSTAEMGLNLFKRAWCTIEAEGGAHCFQTGDQLVQGPADISILRATGGGEVHHIPGSTMHILDGVACGVAFLSGERGNFITGGSHFKGNGQIQRKTQLIKRSFLDTAGALSGLPGALPFDPAVETDGTCWYG